MRKLISIFSLFGFVVACNGQNSQGDDISVTKAQQIVHDQEVVILDVRTPEEYREGHLENARLADYYDAEFEKELEKLPKEKTYLVYCHSGGRSSNARNKMKDMGFKEVYNLEGGISEWKDQGGKTVK